MNREIKFRCWDNLAETMHGNAQTGIYQDPDEIEEFGKILDFACYEVMQYTGINDDKGTEIYEDDIVQRTSMCPGGIDIRGTVEFTEGAWWITNTVNAESLFTEVDGLKILGNIYQNSNLLENTVEAYCEECKINRLHDCCKDISEDIKTTIQVCKSCGKATVDAGPIDEEDWD